MPQYSVRLPGVQNQTYTMYGMAIYIGADYFRIDDACLVFFKHDENRVPQAFQAFAPGAWTSVVRTE